jgi:putative transposase
LEVVIPLEHGALTESIVRNSNIRDKVKMLKAVGFIGKWRLRCRAVADSLEEVGDKLFTFTRFPKSQWKSIRTSNAIERLHEEFKRRIKTQTVLPSAETAAMLFWALLASGQITMRKVDGWRSLNESPSDQTIDLAA